MIKPYFTALLLLWLGIHNRSFSQNGVIDPYRFIATLQFDGQDFFDSGERNYPISYTFNTTQDGNNDGQIDPDDALENLVLFSIGDSIYGTGKTGLTNRGPNDQRPAVYFHYVLRENYTVYEYWLYYADNDWLNKHEHDWEKYFVYVQNTTAVYLKISNHDNFDTYSWCELSLDAQHAIIAIDGGSHAMKNSTEDGVQIAYNGGISLNGGQLNTGAGNTIPWVVYSNDSNVLNAISYTQSPDTFFYGDPIYITNSNEYGDARDAPWKRSEWDNPPVLPFVYLGKDSVLCQGQVLTLDAGSGFTSYLWFDGSNLETNTVDTTGTYYVEVTDDKGCINKDTIVITFEVCGGTDESASSDFDIHIIQNPSNGVFELSGWTSTSKIGDCNIEVYNVLGASVFRTAFNSVQSSVKIDISGKPKGVYFIKVNLGGKVVVKKIFYP